MPEHSPQVDDQVLVDVLLARGSQHLGLVTERDLHVPVVLLGHGADCFEKREHLPPLDVPPCRVSEDPLKRRTMVSGNAIGHGHTVADRRR